MNALLIFICSEAELKWGETAEHAVIREGAGGA